MNRIAVCFFFILTPLVFQAQTDTDPENYGGKLQLKEFLALEMMYPDKAIADKTEGEVIISFTVEKDGNVRDAKVSQSVSPEVDTEAMRIFAKLLWNPGRNIHGTVEMQTSLGIKFQIKKWEKMVKQRGYRKLIYHFEPIDTTNILYQFTEVDRPPKPRFAKADLSYSKFMYDNLKYPEMARVQGVEGKVAVSFVVETNGKPSNVIVTSSVGGGCDEEAVRLIQTLSWFAGVKDNKAVRTQMTLEITFSAAGNQQNNFEPTNSMIR
ncbi:MAG: energy transducer TonB [Bacteroidetes bacterium]|nr:energy transducer TonB [Bacteroidota bacterium]MBU1720970.1 energy transducer TonB [Bacteroidota bacterium]